MWESWASDVVYKIRKVGFTNRQVSAGLVGGSVGSGGLSCVSRARVFLFWSTELEHMIADSLDTK